MREDWVLRLESNKWLCELRPALPTIRSCLSTREKDIKEGWITLEKKGQTILK